MHRRLLSIRALIPLLIALSILMLNGCAMFQDDNDPTKGWSANKLYSAAKEALNEGNYEQAVKYYEKLEARYPYGTYAQQAQIETAYAHYKAGEQAEANAAADRFIKLHPNHPNLDYVYYLKGMIGFNEDLGYGGYVMQQDPTERDPKSMRSISLYGSFQGRISPQSRHSATAAGVSVAQNERIFNARAATYLRSSVLSTFCKRRALPASLALDNTRAVSSPHVWAGDGSLRRVSNCSCSMRRAAMCSAGVGTSAAISKRNNASAASPFGAADSACAQAARTDADTRPPKS